MHAIVRSSQNTESPSLYSIAGKPLILRQIQWLRAVGCDRIVVEVSTRSEDDVLLSSLEGNDPLGDGVVIVFNSKRLDERSLARRGGIPKDVPYLVVEADVLGDSDLAHLFSAADALSGESVHAVPSLLGDLVTGSVRLAGTGSTERRQIRCNGWITRVTSERDALTLSSLILSGALPAEAGCWAVQVHASEIEPGIWVARGARVDAGATLSAPAFVGAGSVVMKGARVGPSAMVGDGSVISEGVTLVDAHVAHRTYIGEGLELRGCLARGSCVLDFQSGEAADVDHEFAHSLVASPACHGMVGRVAASMLLTAMTPVALTCAILGAREPLELCKRLGDVAKGTRVLVGPAHALETLGVAASPSLVERARACPLGAIDIHSAMVTPADDIHTELRARAWYAGTKSWRVDASLLAQVLRQSFGANRATSPIEEQRTDP